MICLGIFPLKEIIAEARIPSSLISEKTDFSSTPVSDITTSVFNSFVCVPKKYTTAERAYVPISNNAPPPFLRSKKRLVALNSFILPKVTLTPLIFPSIPNSIICLILENSGI